MRRPFQMTSQKRQGFTRVNNSFRPSSAIASRSTEWRAWKEKFWPTWTPFWDWKPSKRVHSISKTSTKWFMIASHECWPRTKFVWSFRRWFLEMLPSLIGRTEASTLTCRSRKKVWKINKFNFLDVSTTSYSTAARGLLKKKLLFPVLLLLKLKMKALMPIFVAIIGLKAMKALILSKLAITIVLGFLIAQLVKKTGLGMPMSMMPMMPAAAEPSMSYGPPTTPATPDTSYGPAAWEPSSAGSSYSRVWEPSASSSSHNLAYSSYYPSNSVSNSYSGSSSTSTGTSSSSSQSATAQAYWIWNRTFNRDCLIYQNYLFLRKLIYE